MQLSMRFGTAGMELKLQKTTQWLEGNRIAQLFKVSEQFQGTTANEEWIWPWKHMWKVKKSYKVACLYGWLLEMSDRYEKIWRGRVNSYTLDAFNVRRNLRSSIAFSFTVKSLMWQLFQYEKELNELCQSILGRSSRVLEQRGTVKQKRRWSSLTAFCMVNCMERKEAEVFWRTTQPYIENKDFWCKEELLEDVEGFIRYPWILVRRSRISFVLLLICKYPSSTAFMLEAKLHFRCRHYFWRIRHTHIDLFWRVWAT